MLVIQFLKAVNPNEPILIFDREARTEHGLYKKDAPELKPYQNRKVVDIFSDVDDYGDTYIQLSVK